MPRAIGCRSRAHGAQTIPRHVGPHVERGPIRGRGEPKTDPWPRVDGPVVGTRQFHPTGFGESLGVFLTLANKPAFRRENWPDYFTNERRRGCPGWRPWRVRRATLWVGEGRRRRTDIWRPAVTD